MRAGHLLGQGPGTLIGKRCCPVFQPPTRQRVCRVVRSAVNEDVDIEDKGRASEEDKQAAAKSGKEIYIGFDKSDTGTRAGRKGRFVTDEPGRYPDRDSLTGGWAGGEVGLKQFVEEAARDGPKLEKAKVVESKEEDGKTKTKAITEDGEEIYLGFSKEELEQRKAGGKGRYIRDDPRKYPNKEDFGIFSGVTGGFAGGEKGVRQFVEKGEVSIAEQNRRDSSPILIAALVAGGVTTGAILLNSGVLFSEQALSGSLIPGAGGSGAGGETLAVSGFVIDQNTKLLLNAALLIGGLGSLVIGARAVTKRLRQSSVELKDDAINVGKIAIFWILVLVAALYIIDSQ